MSKRHRYGYGIWETGWHPLRMVEDWLDDRRFEKADAAASASPSPSVEGPAYPQQAQAGRQDIRILDWRLK